MGDGSLAQQRNELKSRLVSQRRIFSSHGFLPQCGYCGQAIQGGAPDMHEVFLTRGDIQGREDLVHLIMEEFNCVLVHPGTCHQEAVTKEGQARCIAHLLVWQGFYSEVFWLTSMAELFKSPVVENTLRLFQLVVEDYYDKTITITNKKS